MVHGGDSGEINFGACHGGAHDHGAVETTEKKYVFELTLEENRALEPAFTLPTLREVIELFDKQVFMNIELKVPHDL